MKRDTTRINPKRIRLDGGTQARVKVDDDVVCEYADLIRKGVALPPPVVFYDGQNHWLADGFHLVMGAILADRLKIDVEVRMGDRRDAILHAVGANASHGLRRSNEDKRSAVFKLLGDEEWSQWSDRSIADRCGVSNSFVSRLRSEVPTVYGTQSPETRTYERNGKIQSMNVGQIGGKSSDDESAEPMSADEASAATDGLKASLDGIARRIADGIEAHGWENYRAGTIEHVPADEIPEFLRVVLAEDERPSDERVREIVAGVLFAEAEALIRA